MLEIYPVDDKGEQEVMCKICHMDYDPDCMCYAAYVDKVLAGACQFVIHGQTGYIISIKESGDADDKDALFIMGRAALNFIDLCGVHNAIYHGKDEDETLLKRIGFSKDDDGKWTMDLTGFFEAPCKHHPEG